jgi:hypothetical protein
MDGVALIRLRILMEQRQRNRIGASFLYILRELRQERELAERHTRYRRIRSIPRITSMIAVS